MELVAKVVVGTCRISRLPHGQLLCGLVGGCAADWTQWRAEEALVRSVEALADCVSNLTRNWFWLQAVSVYRCE